MAPVNITVWSDYVCPWCYIGLGELEQLRASYDFVVDWKPFMLRPDAPEEGWSLPAHIRERIKAGHDPLQARAKPLGLTIHHREWIPNSRRAHEATEYARSKGKLGPFHDALIRRYWSEQQDLHDWAILSAAAKEVGLDADDLQREVSEGKWKAAVNDSIADAGEMGIHAVPTFILENKFALQGAQESDVFRQVFDRLGVKPKQ